MPGLKVGIRAWSWNRCKPKAKVGTGLGPRTSASQPKEGAALPKSRPAIKQQRYRSKADTCSGPSGPTPLTPPPTWGAPREDSNSGPNGYGRQMAHSTEAGGQPAIHSHSAQMAAMWKPGAKTGSFDPVFVKTGSFGPLGSFDPSGLQIQGQVSHCSMSPS